MAAAAAVSPTHDIALFPILADVVEVKKGFRSTAHWSNDFIRLNRWLSNSFAQLITPLDIDSIGQNWEDSNNSPRCRVGEHEQFWQACGRDTLNHVKKRPNTPFFRSARPSRPK